MSNDQRSAHIIGRCAGSPPSCSERGNDEERGGQLVFRATIGFTVTAAAFAVGNISGGAFNPAVAIGACMMGMLSGSAIWMYLVAEAIGGALAAIVFRVLRPDER